MTPSTTTVGRRALMPLLAGLAVLTVVAGAAVAGSGHHTDSPTAAAGPPTFGRGFDLEGHRGTRGLRPEDTLPAFAKALDLGVRTLELDTGITKDGVVVISHDSFINPLVCSDTGPVTSGDKQYPYVGKNIVQLTFAQIETLDCGSRHLIPPATATTDPFYASQLPVPGTRIPTLDQVFDLVEQRQANDVQLNIETKLDPTQPALTVDPAAFVAKDLAVIRSHRNGIARSLLQSFDWRTLAIAAKKAPSLRRVALVDASTTQIGQKGRSPWLGGIDVDAAPWKGDIAYAATSVGARVLSPDYTFLTPAVLQSAHRHHELVVPYTVDDVHAMIAQIQSGVDGIITDYPDRLRDALASLGFSLPRAYPAR